MRGESFSLYAGSESFWSGKLVLHKCVNLCTYLMEIFRRHASYLTKYHSNMHATIQDRAIYRNFPMGDGGCNFVV